MTPVKAEMYKKRSGTSGISGQLYETTVLSLLLLRLQRHETVEEFFLATNMDGIGLFDDICVKLKIIGHNRPLLLFIQLKHKENVNKLLSIGKEFNLCSLAFSIQKIQQNLCDNKEIEMFNSKFVDTDCVFIIYTNANYDQGWITTKTDNTCLSLINELLLTNVKSGPVYLKTDDNNLTSEITRGEITILAERFVKFFCDKPNQSMNIMNDDYMKRYHVYLARNVVNVSKIQTHETKWRHLSIRHDFLRSNNTEISLLRKQMYIEMFKNKLKLLKSMHKKLNKSDLREERENEMITSFLNMPSLFNLTPLIDTHIIYENNKLKFKSKRPQCEEERLEQIQANSEAFYAAIARDTLLTINSKVPITFGNEDLTIMGKNLDKIERRLTYLSKIIVNLCQNAVYSEPYRSVTIKENMDESLLSPNGGFGGAIGNLLDYDVKTNLLKFTLNDLLLQENAKNILLKIQSKLNNLQDYRFKIETTKLPVLSLNGNTITKQLLSTVVIYANQGKHYEVEKIIKQEIHGHFNNGSRNFPTDAETIFNSYHNKIQNWWMKHEIAPYLTKRTTIFQEAIDITIAEQQLYTLHNSFVLNKIKNMEYKFRNEIIVKLNLDSAMKVITITDLPILTFMKLRQYLIDKSSRYAVLDIEDVVNLSTENFKILLSELRKSHRVLIILCQIFHNDIIFDQRLHDFFQAVHEKNVIIVTNNAHNEELMKHIGLPYKICYDKNHSLIDFTNETLNSNFISSCIKFQNQDISLFSFMDLVSLGFVKGAVLNKIIRNEIIVLGETVGEKNYEDIHIKYSYIDRRVRHGQSNVKQFVKTFYDIEQDFVLITANPGMGKSTLLTYLSIKTKECDASIWIVRINLLDYSNFFYKWGNDKTTDTLDILQFLCQAAFKKYDIEMCLYKNDNNVYLKSCSGNDWDAFEINIFLHFYNNQKLVILFDNFDKITANYKMHALRLLNAVKNYSHGNIMWATTTPSDEILPALEMVLGISYVLEYFDVSEQDMFLKKYWQNRLQNANIDASNIVNLESTYSSLMKNVANSTKSELGVDKLMGTPLFLYLIADYIINNYIMNLKNNTANWESHINSFSVYEMLAQEGLKITLFKSAVKPTDTVINELILEHCIHMHKKLAMYSILKKASFYENYSFDELKNIKLLGLEGMEECVTILDEIKNGKKIPGLIVHVANNNIPVFNHLAFEEYFATEYISDLLKNAELDFSTKRLLSAIISVYCSQLRVWISLKKSKDNDFRDIAQKIERSSIIYYATDRLQDILSSLNFPKQHIVRIISSTLDDYDNSFTTCIYVKRLYEYHSLSTYLSKYVTDLLDRTSADDRHDCNVRFISRIIKNMKPHLHKHFSDIEEGELLSRNWGKSDFYEIFGRLDKYMTVGEMYMTY